MSTVDSQDSVAVLETVEPQLAGLLGSGMLDWPGRIAATVFVAGCTMRCPYCHNPELLTVRSSHLLSLNRVLSYIDTRREWLDGVVISGGEPTADPGLVVMLEALKERGVPVKLDTNGTGPELLESVLRDGLVDFVALDVKAVPPRYQYATGVTDAWPAIRRSIRAVIGSGVAHEFRTTCYPLAVDLDDLQHIAADLVGGRRYVLQQFRAARTLDLAAASVRPYTADSLYRAAQRCSLFLPTVVRGA